MHGRKRDEYKAIHRDSKMIQKLSSKATAWHQLQDELLRRQKQWRNTSTTQNIENDIVHSAAVAPDDNLSTTIAPTPDVESPTVNAPQQVTSPMVKKQNDPLPPDRDFIPTTLALLEKALTVNPDPIWLWNFRRTLMMEQLQLYDTRPPATTTTTTTAISDAATTLPISWLEKEHIFTQISLQNNPKAYAVWHYRKWCIQQHLLIYVKEHSLGVDECDDGVQQHQSSSSSSPSSVLLSTELQLCNLLLQKDERNFHCWSYRRFIVSCSLWNVGSTRNNSTMTSHHNDPPSNQNIPSVPTGEWYLPSVLLDPNEDTFMGAQITTGPVVADGISAPMSPPTTTHAAPPWTTEHGVVVVVHPNTVLDIVRTEWDFTTSKIHDNFSNFSAFHYRSKLLPLHIRCQQLQCREATTTTTISKNDDITFQMIQQEFAVVTNAIYTEPDDQTAWWYQVFLLRYMNTLRTGHNRTTTTDDDHHSTQQLLYDEQILQPHLDQLRELQQETNGTSKWVLIGILQCLQFIRSGDIANTTRTRSTTTNTSTCATSEPDMMIRKRNVNDERRGILNKLIQIDSDRKERYKYLLRQIK
jgi:Protein prenyltransferase alpha subunit repeat